MTNYDWVTDEMFDKALVVMLKEMGADQLLNIAGVYELVAEAYNNTILEKLEQERKEE